MNKCSVIAGLLLASHVCMAATIESGTVQVTGGSVGMMAFTVHGDGFSVSGVGSNFFLNMGPLLPPGAIVDGNWGLSTSDFRWGSATVGAESFPLLSLGFGWSHFGFRTPPVTLMGPGLYETAFSFSGGICGTTESLPPVNPCLVDLRELTGYGVATLLVTQLPAPYTELQLRQVTYTFTPEPSTFGIVLACLGLLTAVSRRWHG